MDRIEPHAGRDAVRDLTVVAESADFDANADHRPREQIETGTPGHDIFRFGLQAQVDLKRMMMHRCTDETHLLSGKPRV